MMHMNQFSFYTVITKKIIIEIDHIYKEAVHRNREPNFKNLTHFKIQITKLFFTVKLANILNFY